MAVPERCWYVAYGSNLSAERFQRYLDASEPVVAPADWRAVLLPHRLFFARHTTRWGGGAAFVDPAVGPPTTRARAWLLETRQFLSVLAQENGRPSLHVPADVWALAPGSTVEVNGGWYRTVVLCDPIDDVPALTFTTALPLPLATQPSNSYVDTIVTGLGESHGLGETEARAYLRSHGG